ncbi:ABC transporter substrate-binding protein [Mycolicibacterium litorale]|uniref:Nitrate ABC transporter substrate-binding protein n=1 Tax=Mycolicibacterium litorale TaxID=758802 RepID=A0AAD1IHN7_9MYCO|nr:ABC transporter substrate-binding protein [Mycolicibacterium litorale]MCV7418831.1 ABC transporter substrate-binding protein [Mycolicibacterium litorale]TDY00385.1 ABC-type nitrate/sulfonate/bicarbonate transport system substrate-binding protein [Mycolicibacterium litorale]BBY15782.1 nitrate ABC transporter substrate-binding protein [Mycolicibacterium litorale]
MKVLGRRITAVVLAATTALAMSGCVSRPDSGEGGGEGGTIRFTFAPDPVWDYITDQGILDEMEAESGITIEASSTWDEFGVFAGGHADIVSSASYEVPVIEEETGRDTIIIGKYNLDRSVIITKADNPAKSLADIKSEDVSVYTAVSATLLWGAYAKKMHGVDFRTGGGDYNLIVSDPQQQADLVAKGEVAACVCLPEFAAPGLRSGELKVLYDGRSAADMYSDLVVEGHEGPMINVFLAGNEWAQENPDKVEFFLDVWQRGLSEWEANKAKIIETYPQHFAVEAPEDISFVQDYIADHDWFVRDVRFDQAWADNEGKVFPFLKETGFMAEDQSLPKFRPSEKGGQS